eukprot:3570226-Amphidinium_carterae.1
MPDLQATESYQSSTHVNLRIASNLPYSMICHAADPQQCVEDTVLSFVAPVPKEQAYARHNDIAGLATRL